MCKKYPLVILVIVIVKTVVLPAAGETRVTIDVDLKESDIYVDELFLSLSMPHKISKWDSMPLDNLTFRELYKALAPASLRTPCNPKFDTAKDLNKKKKRRHESAHGKRSSISEHDNKFSNVPYKEDKDYDNGNTSAHHFKLTGSNFGGSDQGNAALEEPDHGKVHGKIFKQRRSVEDEKSKSDHLNFQKSKKDEEDVSEDGQELKEHKDMSVKTWTRLYQFVQYVGWNLTVDLVNLDRTSDGRWDSSRAMVFLQYAAKHNIKIPDFKLGNEPNRYPAKYDIHGITPERTAVDYLDLRRILRGFGLYNFSTIVGPDTTRPSSSKNFFTRFLAAGGCGVVDDIAFHHYYRNNPKHNPTCNDFLNISTMILLEEEFDLVRQFLREYKCNKRMRMTETSSISGGLPDVADRFVAGFLWLDKLGVAAKNGIRRLYRFNLWGGSYSLLDRETSEPNPDYYLTLLYKRLVEGNVFNVTTDNKHIRAYANCAKHLMYPKGSLVIYMVNVLDTAVKLSIKQFPSTKLHFYFFTAGGDQTGVLARTVKVNDVLMTHDMGRNVTFSPRQAQGTNIPMPAHSYGFVVVPASNVSACMVKRPPVPYGEHEHRPYKQQETISSVRLLASWKKLTLFLVSLALRSFK